MSLRYKNSVIGGSLQLQDYYDAIFPIGEIVIGFSAPEIPDGVAAMWGDVSADYDNRALWITTGSTAGTELSGSCPSISGSIIDAGFGSTRALSAPGQTTGAWSGTTSTSGTSSWNTGSGYRVDSHTFDASYSNYVYGASAGTNVVRPTSIVVKIWKRIEPTKPVVTFSPESGSTFSSSTQSVIINAKYANTASYNINGGTEVSFTGKKTVTISGTSTINVTATNVKGTTTESATYTHKD